MKKRFIIGAGICLTIFAVGWLYFKLRVFDHEESRGVLPAHSCYSFALMRSDAHIPCLRVEVEGISFLAKLDMGYDGVLSLPAHLMRQLTYKSDEGMTLFAGVQGKKYQSRVYTIPKLHIGNLTLANFPAEESNSEFESDICTGRDAGSGPSDPMARIGWRAFVGTIILIDLSQSIAMCCDSLETLKEKGCPIEKFVSTNLLSDREFMEFKVTIGDRLARCLLDTGSTLNLIHAPFEGVGIAEDSGLGMVNLNKPLPPIDLKVGPHYLGSCVFHEARLPFEAEAIMGIDFLETQILCIDLIKNRLYFYREPEKTNF